MGDRAAQVRALALDDGAHAVPWQRVCGGALPSECERAAVSSRGAPSSWTVDKTGEGNRSHTWWTAASTRPNEAGAGAADEGDSGAWLGRQISGMIRCPLPGMASTSAVSMRCHVTQWGGTSHAQRGVQDALDRHRFPQSQPPRAGAAQAAEGVHQSRHHWLHRGQPNPDAQPALRRGRRAAQDPQLRDPIQGAPRPCPHPRRTCRRLLPVHLRRGDLLGPLRRPAPVDGVPEPLLHHPHPGIPLRLLRRRRRPLSLRPPGDPAQGTARPPGRHGLHSRGPR